MERNMISNTDQGRQPSHVRPASSTITRADRWDHFLARVGVKRSEHRVEPGLYALGIPTPDAPVFVTANYTLSFDALRSALLDVDGYILVLDTQGVNVWCAAGKGTFGTDELVHRVEETHLHDVVRHRTLILPQLGAPGVAAHLVARRSGFEVEYGPVRASDLPEYLKTGEATPEMRQVRFKWRDRVVLIPLEVVHIVLPLMLLVAVVAILTEMPLIGYGVAAAIVAGVVLFPILLPFIPTRDFCGKGIILGGLVALPFAWLGFLDNPDGPLWRQLVVLVAPLLIMPPATAYMALNFTGSTNFTSRSGVRREIFTYIPIIAVMFVAGLGLQLILYLA